MCCEFQLASFSAGLFETATACFRTALLPVEGLWIAGKTKQKKSSASLVMFFFSVHASILLFVLLLATASLGVRRGVGLSMNGHCVH